MVDLKGRESKTVHAIRGTEDRTIAKYEAEGWQLTSRDPGMLRTSLSFQRPRPTKTVATLVAAAVLVLLSIVGLTLGVIFGDDDRTPSSSAAPESTRSGEVTEAPASSAPGSASSTWEETRDGQLAFGQTAHFRSTAGRNNIPLDIVVEAAVPFTPSASATVFDARAGVGGITAPLHETTVYFTVTITNLSSSQAFSTDAVFSDVRKTGADDQVSLVLDGDVVGMVGWPQEIPPGQAFTLKDGYSVQDATVIEYELAIDGLAGRSFSFSL